MKLLKLESLILIIILILNIILISPEGNLLKATEIHSRLENND